MYPNASAVILWLLKYLSQPILVKTDTYIDVYHSAKSIMFLLFSSTIFDTNKCLE